MEHTWTKIKSWISSYLTTSNISDLNSYMDSWKTTNFGSGNYNIASSSSLSIRNDSLARLNRESEINLDEDEFTIRGLGEIRIASYGYSITITRKFGIALLYNLLGSGDEKNTTITNNSGYDIRAIAISVTSKTGTSLRIQNKTVDNTAGNNILSIALTNGVPTLLMWCEA